MAEFLEIVMIVSFGASWPLNVIKSYYEQNQNEETKQNLSALAALFGVSENP
jgi:hypothetical protein